MPPNAITLDKLSDLIFDPEDKKRVKSGVINPIVPPRTKTLEIMYFRDLLPVVRDLVAITNQLIIPAIPGLSQSAQSVRPDHKGHVNRISWMKWNSDRIAYLETEESYYKHLIPKWDDTSDDIELLMRQARERFGQEWTEQDFQALALAAADRTNDQSVRYFTRLAKQVPGIDPLALEPWLREEVKLFTRDNVNLITSMSEDHFDKVEGTLIRDIRAGKKNTEIAENIRKISRQSKNRTKLIARDQTAKFYSSLQENRMKDAGIDRYRWSTAADERVRASHRRLNGRFYSFNKPPSVGNPGQPIQCRCVAIPVIE